MLRKYFLVAAALVLFLLLSHRVLIPGMSTKLFGLSPVNDSLLWFDVASDIIDGVKATGRPVFSLLLVLLKPLLGTNWVLYAVFFIVLHAAAVAVALYILRHARNNSMAVILMAFFSMWQISMRVPFYTESLASSVMVIGFALIIRGMRSFSYNFVLLGLFCTGFAQSIRPWDFVSMAVLPLFPLIYDILGRKRQGGLVADETLRTRAPDKWVWNNGFILSMLSAFAVAASFSCYFAATTLFCSAKSQEVFPMFLYSQTYGGAGDFVVYKNPKVMGAILRDKEHDEVNKIIFSQAWANFKKNPRLFLRAVKLSCRFYLRSLPVAFSREKIGSLGCVAFLVLLFFMYFFDERKKKVIAFIRGLSWRRPALWACAAALFFRDSGLFWTGIIFTGIIVIFVFATRAEKIFFSLYALGNLASLCFMSGQGAGRYWMASEALSYYSASYAAAFIMGGLKKEPEVEGREFIAGGGRFFSASAAVLISLAVIFLALPLGIQRKRLALGREIPLKTDELSVRRQFNLGPGTPLVSPKLMHLLLINWPSESFDKVNGAYCYYKLRYRGYHAFYKKPGEGDKEMLNHRVYWIFTPMPFERVIYLEDRIIFPHVNQDKMARFEGKEIAVFGRLICRPRKRYTDSGYILLAESVACMDGEGKLQWVDMGSLK